MRSVFRLKLFLRLAAGLRHGREHEQRGSRRMWTLRVWAAEAKVASRPWSVGRFKGRSRTGRLWVSASEWEWTAADGGALPRQSEMTMTGEWRQSEEWSK